MDYISDEQLELLIHDHNRWVGADERGVDMPADSGLRPVNLTGAVFAHRWPECVNDFETPRVNN
jgi:hypothetical protein